MGKLSVATRTGVAATKINKILKCMASYPEGITPKVIAFHSSINVNTVKSILPKLKEVKKVMRGVYKVVVRGDAPHHPFPNELHDWAFHNLVLSCQLLHFPGKLITSTHSFKIVNAEFTISKSGNATLRVACDNPLNISSICIVFAYFRELIGLHSNDPITATNVFISTIEFNKDYTNLRLDGVRCITLDGLAEQFKVYQKRLVMRVEHKTKVRFTPSDIVEMLTNNPNSLEMNMKLSAQREQIDKLTNAANNNTQMLLKLMQGMKGP